MSTVIISMREILFSIESLLNVISLIIEVQPQTRDLLRVMQS